MPNDNRAKGPRLYLRDRADRAPVYVIRDTGQPERSTGTGKLAAAEKALAQYILQKPRVGNGPAAPTEITVGACLGLYDQIEVDHLTDPARARYALQRLQAYWQTSTVDRVTKSSCANYVRWRKTEVFRTSRGTALQPPMNSTIAKELRTLRRALRCAHEEGCLTQVPYVQLPELQQDEKRLPTESEVDQLIAAADHEGCRRFVYLAAQTGTRKSRILQLQWEPNLAGGWIDVETGWIHRSARGQARTNKRAEKCKLPPDLLARCRIWKADGCRWVCHHGNGQPMSDVRKQFYRAAKRAGLTDITPHRLKHFAITKAIRTGADPVEAAAYFSTTIRTMQRHYFHNDPDRQTGMANLMQLKDNTSNKDHRR
jgi:integrase